MSMTQLSSVIRFALTFVQIPWILLTFNIVSHGSEEFLETLGRCNLTISIAGTVDRGFARLGVGTGKHAMYE